MNGYSPNFGRRGPVQHDPRGGFGHPGVPQGGIPAGGYPNPYEELDRLLGRTMPFSAREQEMLMRGQEMPGLDEVDVEQLAMHGLMPPEFERAPDLSMFGRAPYRGGPSPDIGRRVLEEDAEMALRMPEMPAEIIARRGTQGDAFRGLEPGNLGGGVSLYPNNKRVTVVQARGIDALTPVGIMLGYSVIGQTAPTDDIFVQALIKWGTGSGSHAALVDVGRGTQIRLASASFVEVSMQYTPDPAISPARTGPELLGIALLGYGTPSFRASPARYTQRVSSVTSPNGKSGQIPIPDYAQSFGIIGEQGPVTGATVLMSAGTTADAFGHTAYAVLADGQDESQWYVPNGMRAMVITNNTGISQPFDVVFSLML